MNAVGSLRKSCCVKLTHFRSLESGTSFFVGDDLNIWESLVRQEVPQVLPRDVDVVLINQALQDSVHCDGTSCRHLIGDEVFDIVENSTKRAWPSWHGVHVIRVCFVALEVAGNRALGNAHYNPDVVLGDGGSFRLVGDGNDLLLPLHRPEGWFHACKGRYHHRFAWFGKLLDVGKGHITSLRGLALLVWVATSSVSFPGPHDNNEQSINSFDPFWSASDHSKGGFLHQGKGVASPPPPILSKQNKMCAVDNG